MNLPHKIMIFKNGTIKDDLKYEDLCREEHEARIAYNNNQYFFEIDSLSNTMVDFPHYILIAYEYGHLSYDFEILGSFFAKHNVKPTWVNCNYSYGVFDDELGHWTGAVGQVIKIKTS